VSESIVTSSLTKYYNSFPGLVGLDLSVFEGEVFGFLGPNGAGKTTTIRLLMGLITPTRGRVFLMGRELRDDRRFVLGNIGYLPGDVGFYNNVTGDEYLAYFMKLRAGGEKHGARRKLDALKKEFDIDYGKKIAGYSKGMRQILGIIQAFLHDPRLIILDEPTSGLDPVMQERFYRLVGREKDEGRTIFLSSHNLNEVERICDRVGFIKKGELMTIERLGGEGSLAGRRVGLVVRGDTEGVLEGLDSLSGVADRRVEGKTIRFLYRDDMNDLVEWAGTVDLADFTCEPPSVEDFFMSLYGE
jgi:ABC-2 type transport system ATP-binding protein